MKRIVSLLLAVSAVLMSHAFNRVSKSFRPDFSVDSVYDFAVPEGTVSSRIVLLFNSLKPPAGHGTGKSSICIVFCDSVSSELCRLVIQAGNNEVNSFEGQRYYRMSLCDAITNTIVAEYEISETRDRPLFSGKNSVEIVSDMSGMMHVGVDRYRSDAVFKFPYEPASIKLSVFGDVTFNDVGLEFDVVDVDSDFNMSSIEKQIRESDDSVVGFYSYFDRENDPKFAEPGGYYKLAVVGDGEGYRIIYLDGAKVGAGIWRCGMTKGRLLPTMFRSHFDLEWIDAKGEKMTKEQFATFDAGLKLLELNFPLYYTKIRFRRVTDY